jgi:hypothetical protein
MRTSSEDQPPALVRIRFGFPLNIVHWEADGLRFVDGPGGFTWYDPRPYAAHPAEGSDEDDEIVAGVEGLRVTRRAGCEI